MLFDAACKENCSIPLQKRWKRCSRILLQVESDISVHVILIQEKQEPPTKIQKEQSVQTIKRPILPML